MTRKRPLILLILFTLGLTLALAACGRRGRDVPPTPTSAATAPQSGGPRDTGAPTPTVPPVATAASSPLGSPLLAVDPASIDWPPQVVYSSPAPGEETLLNGAITIRFDQPMDRASVENALAVFVAGEESTAVAGTFDWPRTDTLIFTPRSELKRATDYRVRIAATAQSQNGRTLPDVVELELTTVGYLAVGQVIPGPDVTQVQTDAAITVLFNRPVVPLVSTGQQADLPQPLSFQPDIPGNGRWVSTSIYRFEPSEPLAGATRYEVTVNAGLEDVTGGVLADPYRWSFTTLRPSVTSIEPGTGSRDISPTAPITITFNMPMDRASTQGAIALDPAAPLTFRWSDDGRVLSVTPQRRLELETRYRLTIGQSARALNGQATLDRTTTAVLTTVPFPAIRNLYPQPGTQAPSYQRGVTIEFASPMDTATVENRIRIEPAPDELQYYFDMSAPSAYFNIDFFLERNTEYVITIPGDVADPYGNTLGEDYVWRFTTAGAPPLSGFNLAYQLSMVSNSYPTEVVLFQRNVAETNVRLLSLGLPINYLLEPWRLFDRAPSGELVWSRAVPLSAARDQTVTTTLQLGDGAALPTGVYYLSAAAPEVTDEFRWWQMQRALLIVADTNLVVKEMFGTVHVWATDLASGQPAQGQTLTLYDNRQQQLGTAVTDANGLATFDYEPSEGYLPGVLVVSGEPGGAGFGIASSTWNESARPWQFGINYDTSDEPPQFGYIYTDRPIYRPGDTVHFRGILRRSNYGRYLLPDPGSVQLRFEEQYYFDEQPLSVRMTAELDANGNFSGEFEIPDNARLTTYNIYFDEGNVAGGRSFIVAEYRRPEFLVTVTADKTQALVDESVVVTVEASYFFGGPAADLELRWSVQAEPHFPAIDLPYSFGEADLFYYDPYGPFSGGSVHLLDGSGRTDGDGRFTINLPADLLKELKEGSRRVTVEATILDVGEFGISSRTNIIYHPAEVYVGLTPDDYLGTAGRETAVNLITVDWDGEPVANRPVELVFYRRTWNVVRDNRFGPYFTSWEPVDTEVSRTQVTSDADGLATASFVPERGGTYRITATVSDTAGRQQTSSLFIWVTDVDFIGWRTSPREKQMDLAPDQESYRPGDTARILVQSPFTGPVRAWLIIERGPVLEQRIITLQSNSDVVDIPITANFAPNVFVTIAAVKGIDSSNEFADIRLGIVELPVATDQLALNLSLTPRGTTFAPRDTVTYDIQVTDYLGRPVQADISLALVDLAVLTLVPDNAEPILDAFYSRQSYRSQIGATLFQSAEGLPIEIPEEQAGGFGGGGNGVAAESAVALRDSDEEGDESVRREFPDTAFWRAVLTTDANGAATVEIPLPDTATTWRLSSKAVTVDSLVGQSTVDIVATLPLLIRPVTPRFFTVGDIVQLGAVINNNTDDSLEVTVSLETAGLTLNSAAEQTITVPARRGQLVRWSVTVEDVTFADLTFRARGGEYRDATKPSFGVGPDQLVPVYRYNAQDLVGTSGVLETTGRRVEAVLLPPAVDTRRGELVVRLNPSLAASLIDALNYIETLDYDPVCAHGLVDRLLPNVATARALRLLGVSDPELLARLDEAIAADLDKVVSLQKSGGGWGYCASRDIDPYLTAYVMLGLVKAQEAGYGPDVPPIVLERAMRYLNGQVRNPARLNERYEVNRQAFFLYVLAEADQPVAEDVDDLFAEHRGLLDPYARALLALAYELDGASGDNNQRALLSDLNDSVIVSATGAHWEDAERDWQNLSSSVRGTAVIISALARIQPDHALAPQAVRWLMAARIADRWPSTHDTVWSILALTDWMEATGELSANYDYLVNVNADTVTEGRFTTADVTSGRTLTIPVSDLVVEAVNFVDMQRGAGDGRLYYTMHLDSFIAAETVEPVDRGLIVQRTYYDAACDPVATVCQPISQIAPGQSVRVELTIIVANDRFYVNVVDPIPAGTEAVDPGLLTSAASARPGFERTDQDYRYGYWGWWYFNQIQFKDEKVIFTTNYLPAGTYQYTYTLNAVIPGRYQVMPAIAYEEFFPEVFGRSNGMLFTISE